MKILFTSPILQYPLAGGPALRVANCIKALNSTSELYLLSRVNKIALGGEKAEIYYRQFCRQFDYIPSQKISTLQLSYERVSRIKNWLVRNVLSIPLLIVLKGQKIIGENNKLTDEDYIVKFVTNNNIDIIWFGYGNISYTLMQVLKQRLPEIKMVCDTDSVWSKFVLRELDVEKDPNRRIEIEQLGAIKELEETDWTNFMDVTTGVSEVDVDYYKSIAKNEAKVKLFSNVLDLDEYKIKPEKIDNFKNPCIYLAGTFWENSPMEYAARWVIKDILPKVRESIPDIHFYIIGKGSDLILNDIHDDNITITGMLDTVLPYLCHSDIALVPLKFESGTRFKILEAAACGIPIVSTILGAEGIPVIDKHDMLLADNAEQFANAITQLIQNKKIGAELAANCKKLIEEKYSIKTLVKEAQVIINYLIK